ncbi:MAG: glycosyltransferase family 4 protein [Xanthomonadales bacterium]|nr:glycosyltransferase family 4 protein [Xanthomonadales bacterium]
MLLKQHGHTTSEFFRFNDDLLKLGFRGAIRGSLSTPWNPFSARSIRRAIDEFKPGVVHVHNTFPLISPSIFHAIGSRAARVLTLHNYRLFCPAATPLRDGRVCTECIDRQNVWPALRFACYRDSRLATLPVALGVAAHRNLGTWRHQVDAFIVLTAFQRDLMVKAGLPKERIHIKPNFYPGVAPSLSWEKRNNAVVFAGRLTAGKGIESLVQAWITWGSSAPKLRIAGDGELRQKLEQIAATNPQVKIRFLGQLSKTETQQEIARSRLLVLPSISLETFGLVILEAFASGTPAAVSNVGPLPSIVRDGQNGIVFSPDNPQSLLDAVKTSWECEGKLEQLASGARQSFESMYTADINYRRLVEIYEQAVEVSRARKTS